MSELVEIKKIAVIGPGAIGNLVAGYLRLKGQDVSLIDRAGSGERVRRLNISGTRGEFDVSIDVLDKLDNPPDLVILCVKTQDVAEAVASNQVFIRDAIVLTVQNGVRADEIVAKHVPPENVLGSVVMFISTKMGVCKVVHNSEGNWILGSAFPEASGAQDAKIAQVSSMLDKAFPTVVSEKIKGMKYLKIFVNANNCIAAILGVPLQEAFSDVKISRIGVEIWREGFEVISTSGIELASLPNFTLENLEKLLSLPAEEAAHVLSGIMCNLSEHPIYGSILQSIKRGRFSEIDYINGEFVSLAQEHGSFAPLNEKLVQMVHQVESTNRHFDKQALLSHTEGLMA